MFPLRNLIWLMAALALGASGCSRSGNSGELPASPVTNLPVVSSKSIEGISPLPASTEDDAAVMEGLLRADELASNGQISEAEAAYLALLKKSPDNEEIHFNLGYLYGRTGRTNEAIAEYEAALQRLPTYAEAHSNLGNLLVRLKRFDVALQHLEAAVAADPANSRSQNNLGTALATAGQITNAIPYFARAAQLNPDFAEAWFNLGRSQLMTGRLDEAIIALEAARRIDSSLVPAQTLLQRAYQLRQARGY